MIRLCVVFVCINIIGIRFVIWLIYRGSMIDIIEFKSVSESRVIDIRLFKSEYFVCMLNK